jgi:hypothetical protein
MNKTRLLADSCALGSFEIVQFFASLDAVGHHDCPALATRVENAGNRL